VQAISKFYIKEERASCNRPKTKWLHSVWRSAFL